MTTTPDLYFPTPETLTWLPVFALVALIVVFMTLGGLRNDFRGGVLVGVITGVIVGGGIALVQVSSVQAEANEAGLKELGFSNIDVDHHGNFVASYKGEYIEGTMEDFQGNRYVIVLVGEVPTDE